MQISCDGQLPSPPPPFEKLATNSLETSIRTTPVGFQGHGCELLYIILASVAKGSGGPSANIHP